jgi:hypothetical protein
MYDPQSILERMNQRILRQPHSCRKRSRTTAKQCQSGNDEKGETESVHSWGENLGVRS